MIDLHIHTTASDGEYSPEEVVDLAIKNNLRAIAITDHDVLDGIQKAVDYSNGKNIEIVPGIEIRCNEPETGFKEIHILGLFIDHKNKDIIKFTEKIKTERINQKRKMIDNLRKQGYDITFEEVIKEVGNSFGRPHIAKVLMKRYPKEFSSIQDAFNKCLGVGKPAYVDRTDNITMKAAINIIKKSKGISFLAHPGTYKKEDSLELIKMFQDSGGQGIETYYPYNIIFPSLKINEKENSKMIKFYKKIAGSLRMIETGGSDFHGGERDTMEKIKIPQSVLYNIKKKLDVSSKK